MSNTGYREMLRDRCPKVVNYALKWCKTKEKWLDHVYKSWIWVYSSKGLRLAMTRELLGLDKTKRQFVFDDTIDWENLTIDEINYWKKISNWVSWFQKSYAYINNAYDISKQKGKDIASIKLEIMTHYLKSMCPSKNDSEEVRAIKNRKINELTDFLIDCFEDRI